LQLVVANFRSAFFDKLTVERHLRTVMNKREIERKLVVFLFILVLVVFSFAERDSKKLERVYRTAQLIKKGSAGQPDVAAEVFPSNSNH